MKIIQYYSISFIRVLSHGIHGRRSGRLEVLEDRLRLRADLAPEDDRPLRHLRRRNARRGPACQPAAEVLQEFSGSS